MILYHGSHRLFDRFDLSKEGDKAVDNKLNKKMKHRKYDVEKAAAEFLDGLGVFCHVWPEGKKYRKDNEQA